MVVRLDGSIDDRKANTILVGDSLKGRVEQVLDTKRLIVMGQTVTIDGQTHFDNGARPSVGEQVEVHGQLAALCRPMTRAAAMSRSESPWRMRSRACR